MAFPQVLVPANVESKSVKDMIKSLNDYKSKNWAIGLTGDTFVSDSFLGFFVDRHLPFSYYVSNKGVLIGTPAAYETNVHTLESYLDHVRTSEKNETKRIIAQIKDYKAKNWAIGLNGDTLQPDGFDAFYSKRGLSFLPYVRSTSGISIGDSSAYQKNIDNLNAYIAAI